MENESDPEVSDSEVSDPEVEISNEGKIFKED